MMITQNMSQSDMINEVLKLTGNSYSFMDMPIDGNDEVSLMVKQEQAREFARVASIRLYVQKKMQQEKGKQQQEKEKAGDDLDMEFKDFKNDAFIQLNLNEIKIVDIIIDMKIDDIEIEQTRNERTISWVMRHAKY